MSVCAPSFLYPAGYAFNVERLRSVVDEVELLLFESDARYGLPAPEEIALIAGFAASGGLKLNVHLPLDIDIGSSDPTLRSQARETICRVIGLTEPLEPGTFILHVPRAVADDLPSWRARVHESLALLPDPRSRFAVETLAADLREIADTIRELGLSVCIDIGHLLLAGRDVSAFFDAFRGSITMVHLHGVQGQRDHLPLSVMNGEARARMRRIFRREEYRGSLSIEVFSVEDFRASLPALEEMMSW